MKVNSSLMGIGLLALAGGAAACQDSNAAPLATTIDHHSNNNDNNHSTTVTYDDFANGATHSDRWFDVTSFLGLGEPEVNSSLSFANGKLSFEATPFTTSFDNHLDHLKHLSLSTQSFDAPLNGWVQFSADIDAQTPGGTGYRKVPQTNKVLKQGQQAAATFIVSDAGASGARFAWYVSDTRALAVYERSPLDGDCNLNTSYTQILGEVNLSARQHSNQGRTTVHNFAIRYRRNTGDPTEDDKVDWMMDGHVRYRVRAAGVPETGTGNRAPTFPAQGPGEELKNQLNSFNVGYGLASMVDVFPFNACSTGQVSIPASERLFGQGASAEIDNVKVKTFVRNGSGSDDDGDSDSH